MKPARAMFRISEHPAISRLGCITVIVKRIVEIAASLYESSQGLSRAPASSARRYGRNRADGTDRRAQNGGMHE